jgi:serine/threonine protein kinase
MAKFLAKGSYGCVVRPAYNCNKLLSSENTISKLFIYKNDWEKEVKINKIIEQLDPNNFFTVKMMDNCMIKMDGMNITKKCNLEKANDFIYQIVYEYGGDEIIKIFQHTEIINAVIILKKFVNIFEGICILDANDIIHHDIKPNNILYNIAKNKFYLIDFGLYITKDDKHIHDDTKYVYYPSEYAFLYYIKNGKSLNKINVENYKKLIGININFLMKKVIIDIKIRNKIKNIYDNLDKDKEAIYNKIILNRDININNKIDVYMLGLTLYDFTIAIFIHCTELNNISKIPIEILDLISDMTNIDPYERVTIQEATERYKLIIHKM